MDTITFIYNVRINSEIRKENLFKVISQLEKVPKVKFSIRVRGKFSSEIICILRQSCDPNKFTFFEESKNRNWKIDTFEQVLRAQSSFYCLLQEDHMLVSERDKLLTLIMEFISHDADFMPLSFYPHFQTFIHKFRRDNHFKHGKHLRSWRLTKELIRDIPIDERNYLVSLVGIFKREFLIKILLTERPFIKDFDLKTPFNFEQKSTETWFLPIVWAFPNYELFACTDDDHGIEGYSLASRFGYKGSFSRKIEHHLSDDQNPEILDRLDEVGRFLGLTKHYYRRVRYSVYSILTIPKRKLLIRTLNKRFRSV